MYVIFPADELLSFPTEQRACRISPNTSHSEPVTQASASSSSGIKRSVKRRPSKSVSVLPPATDGGTSEPSWGVGHGDPTNRSSLKSSTETTVFQNPASVHKKGKATLAESGGSSISSGSSLSTNNTGRGSCKTGSATGKSVGAPTTTTPSVIVSCADSSAKTPISTTAPTLVKSNEQSVQRSKQSSTSSNRSRSSTPKPSSFVQERRDSNFSSPSFVVPQQQQQQQPTKLTVPSAAARFDLSNLKSGSKVSKVGSTGPGFVPKYAFTEGVEEEDSFSHFIGKSFTGGVTNKRVQVHLGRSISLRSPSSEYRKKHLGGDDSEGLVANRATTFIRRNYQSGSGRVASSNKSVGVTGTTSVVKTLAPTMMAGLNGGSGGGNSNIMSGGSASMMLGLSGPHGLHSHSHGASGTAMDASSFKDCMHPSLNEPLKAQNALSFKLIRIGEFKNIFFSKKYSKSAMFFGKILYNYFMIKSSHYKNHINMY